MVFFQALWIGLSIAAPVGPIGLLVIQRTLRHGPTLGVATGLGAAVADAAYGAVGAFGVTAVTTALQRARLPLAVLGAAFLLWLAWHTWHGVPAAGETRCARAADVAPRPWGAFAGTVLLTLANPATIVSFAAVFAALGNRAEPASPWLMVAGVLTGSALWWLLLCALVGASRQRFGVRQQRAVGRASALMLAGFALWSLTRPVVTA